MKIAIYCRVSTNEQEADNQLIQLREYCKKQNYEIFKLWRASSNDFEIIARRDKDE